MAGCIEAEDSVSPGSTPQQYTQTCHNIQHTESRYQHRFSALLQHRDLATASSCGPPKLATDALTRRRQYTLHGLHIRHGAIKRKARSAYDPVAVPVGPHFPHTRHERRIDLLQLLDTAAARLVDALGKKGRELVGTEKQSRLGRGSLRRGRHANGDDRRRMWRRLGVKDRIEIRGAAAGWRRHRLRRLRLRGPRRQLYRLPRGRRHGL